MTVAGTTAQPLQPAAPFARWWLLVGSVLVALEPEHLSLWMGEVAS